MLGSHNTFTYKSAKWKISNIENKFGILENYTYLCIVEQETKY